MCLFNLKEPTKVRGIILDLKLIKVQLCQFDSRRGFSGLGFDLELGQLKQSGTLSP
jgi:hypothetical protein